MFRNDYIMKMIQEFSIALAKILGLKAENKIEESQQVLTEALRYFTGMSKEAIEKLSDKDLINLVSGGKEFNIEKCSMLGELLKQQADIYMFEDDISRANNLYLKSFNILVQVIMMGNSLHLARYSKKVKDLMERIGQFEVPHESKQLLLQYYELTGNYAKAEDILFELLGSTNDKNVLLDQGISFYERLTEKNHKELEEGNLPINEVLEGREKLLNIQSSQPLPR
ncbi:MAG: DUF6483 family protein [Desulfitobacteriaceae bacterium]